jgi:NAD(P)H-hydrate epimerase
MHVLRPDQMRAVDAEACAQVGADALMREAGRCVAERIRAMAPHGLVVAFAGPGNNGGDAFAALAELDASHRRVICAAPLAEKSDARRAAEGRAMDAGVEVRAFPQTIDEARSLAEGAAITVDALLGTGARLPIGIALSPAISALDGRERMVLAIDVPSGVDALTGTVCEPAVRATCTVTFASLKPGLLFETARDNVGELWLADIGIASALLDAQPRTFAAVDDAELASLLPRRAAGSDKRSAGAPLVIAGSAQFPGAAILCARAAARAGAGYVTVATSPDAARLLRDRLIEQVVVAIADTGSPDDAVAEILDIAKRNGSIAIGPGLGLDDRTGAIVRGVIERAELPMVIDASALFHLAKHLDILSEKPIVLTPHAGEFARLSGLGTIVPGERVARLHEFVERAGVTTLLKGQTTLIDDGGSTLHINISGTSALATAGSGDVLSGIIATLLSQGLSPIDAARAGAYWHGRAGQICSSQRAVGTIAGDLPEALAAAAIPRPIARLNQIF